MTSQVEFPHLHTKVAKQVFSSNNILTKSCTISCKQKKDKIK